MHAEGAGQSPRQRVYSVVQLKTIQEILALVVFAALRIGTWTSR